jgi:hypothetical protein
MAAHAVSMQRAAVPWSDAQVPAQRDRSTMTPRSHTTRSLPGAHTAARTPAGHAKGTHRCPSGMEHTCPAGQFSTRALPCASQISREPPV